MPPVAREPHGSSLRRSAASAALAGLAIVLAAGVVAPPVRTVVPMVLQPGAGRVDLSPALDVLVDPSGALDLDAARRAAFAPAPRAGPGLVRGALWLRFAVANGADGPREWVVTFPGATLDRIDAWIEDASDAAVGRSGGLAVASASRTLALRPGWHELPLRLGAGERVTILARLASRGPLHAGAAAEEHEPLARRLAASVAGDAALASILLALAVAAAAAFALRRARVHRDLALLAGALGALSLAVGGVGPALLWPGSPWWAAAAPPALAALAAHLGLRVAGGLLGFPLRGVSGAVAWFAAASAALALPFPRAGNVAAGVAVLAALGTAAVWTVRSLREGAPGARALAAGAAPLAVFALAAVLAGAGLAPAPSSGALAFTFALAVLGAGAASVTVAPLRLALDAPAPERSGVDRALEARTRELGHAVEALRREREARRPAEEGRREAEDALRRSEEARREAEDALRRSEEGRREAEEALRHAEEERRAADDALRRADEERREVAGARRLARIADAPADVPEAPPRIAEVPRGPPAVLLAEDDDVSIAATRRALERAGYRVIAAGDGRRALAACESAGGVDVVVADVGLLGMGGKELADRILARWPATRVVLTAGSAHDVLGEEPGGFPFLAKPYSPGALAAKVRDLLAPRVERKAG